MSITSIERDTLASAPPSIVRIVSTDTLSTIGTTGYVLAQAANIAALNAGAFDWLVTDFVLVDASDGWAFFNISTDFQSLILNAFLSIPNGSVTLAKLATGIHPSSIIKFDGQHTTVGGSPAEAITVTGALSTDRAFVQMVDNGTNNTTVLEAAVTSNTLTVTFSGDPGNDAIINYMLIRTAT